jgi:sec-independent protein translocase protein TatA
LKFLEISSDCIAGYRIKFRQEANMNFGTTEILLIVAVLFLLFGASRLPQLARSLGQSRKAFREGMREAEEEERAEKQLKNGAAPKLTEISDEQLMEELRRRAQSKES